MTLKEAAATVLRLIDTGEYQSDGQTVRFEVEQANAVNGTRLYTPDQLALFGTPSGSPPTIRVTDGTTQTIAQEMASTGERSVGLLNFASARNPGGGFLKGAKAQEEDLCRCSGLYPCLLQCNEYYETNRNQSSLLYTDYAIFSPQVPFFKTHGTGELLSKSFFVSVIAAPAPNSGPFLRERPDAVEELQQTFLRRWRNVLRIAGDQGITRLLLGAWGCGAFGGDPVMASTTAKHDVVATNDKQRFALSEDGLRIRANQGHSVADVDLNLQATKPPELLYHGTVAPFIDSICQQGLRKRSRNHVHLSADESTAVKVAQRRGKPIVLIIEAGKMEHLDHNFFLSANGVWLTNEVPTEFICFE